MHLGDEQDPPTQESPPEQPSPPCQSPRPCLRLLPHLKLGPSTQRSSVEKPPNPTLHCFSNQRICSQPPRCAPQTCPKRSPPTTTTSSTYSRNRLRKTFPPIAPLTIQCPSWMGSYPLSAHVWHVPVRDAHPPGRSRRTSSESVHSHVFFSCRYPSPACQENGQLSPSLCRL